MSLKKKADKKPTQKLEKFTKRSLWFVAFSVCTSVVIYKFDWLVTKCPFFSWFSDNSKYFMQFPEAAQSFGVFGDFFGGVLNPIIGALTLYAVWQTLNIQHDKEDGKEQERLQQDDFNRKFDSYREVTAQITSQMLYPWAKNEPPVKGKAALARWLEIICSEKVNVAQKSGKRNFMLLTSYFLNYSPLDLYLSGTWDWQKSFYEKFGKNAQILFSIRDVKNKISFTVDASNPFEQKIDYSRSKELIDPFLKREQNTKDSNGKSVITIYKGQAEMHEDTMVFWVKKHWRNMLRNKICNAAEFVICPRFNGQFKRLISC